MSNHGGQKDWDIFQMLKVRNCQPRIPYPVEIFFRSKGEFRMFSDKGKQRICHQQTYLKEQEVLKQKEYDKRRKLATSERKKNTTE